MKNKAVMYKRLDTMHKEALIREAEVVQAYYEHVYIRAELVFAINVKCAF